MKRYNLSTFLQDLHKRNRVLVVPRIQRSYAQGREDEKNVRRLFLRALFKVLRGEQGELVLNYAFGGLCDNRFELMDGQQRLTTLFLLYWYMNAGKRLPDHFASFVYETRPTSTEFVRHLVQEPLPVQGTRPADPVGFIRNGRWFTYTFEQDPSVSAMLTMLQDIHREMRSEDDVCKMQERLECIRFYVPEPEHMDNPDDQYLKINDRGLSLTPFECFKADLVAHLSSVDVDEEVRNSYLGKLDAEWLLYFEPSIAQEQEITPENLSQAMSQNSLLQLLENRCQSLDAETSRRYLRFFSRFCAHRFATSDHRLATALGKKPEEVWKFFHSEAEWQTQGKGGINGQVEKYQGFDCFRPLLTPEFLKNMDRVLDALCHVRQEGWSVFSPEWGGGAPDFFAKQEQYSLSDAVLFSSFCDYVLALNSWKSYGECNLKCWIRIARNIIENSDLDTDAAAAARMHEINKLSTCLHEDGDVYASLAKHVTEKDKGPVLGEIRKAKLIVNSREDGFWENQFLEIHKHPYLRGLAGFLLDFAGVGDDATDTTTRTLFDKYAKAAKAFFAADRNGKRLIDGGDAVWERAALTCGDYLISIGSERFNLLTTAGRTGYSWKHLLLKGKDAKKKVLKDTLDKIVNHCGWGQDEIRTILADICNSHGHSDDLWRDLLVHNPRLISRCAQGNMYWGDKILLLSKKRTNSQHWELFTCHLEGKLSGFRYDHQRDGLVADLADDRLLLVEAFTEDRHPDLRSVRLTVISQDGQSVQGSEEQQALSQSDGWVEKVVAWIMERYKALGGTSR